MLATLKNSAVTGLEKVSFHSSIQEGQCQTMFKLHTTVLISHAAAAAAAKSRQSCPTLCDLIDGSPPGSPSLGFSRQEHWSGLPFPSLFHMLIRLY